MEAERRLATTDVLFRMYDVDATTGKIVEDVGLLGEATVPLSVIMARCMLSPGAAVKIDSSVTHPQQNVTNKFRKKKTRVHVVASLRGESCGNCLEVEARLRSTTAQLTVASMKLASTLSQGGFPAHFLLRVLLIFGLVFVFIIVFFPI